MVQYTGICLSGVMTVRMGDGTEETIGAGDVLAIEPRHDAWAVGDEPWHLVRHRCRGLRKTRFLTGRSDPTGGSDPTVQLTSPGQPTGVT